MSDKNFCHCGNSVESFVDDFVEDQALFNFYTDCLLEEKPCYDLIKKDELIQAVRVGVARYSDIKSFCRERLFFS